MNHSSSSSNGSIKTIEDLDDNVLTLILFRLPSCRPPIVTYKLVNKRWYSLISDPKFPSHFCDHKKKTISEPGSDINDDEPPWTFIANLIDCNLLPRYHYSVGNASNNESVFASPKFSMGFLPGDGDFLVETTFKDLVLCSGKKTRGDRVFYIANPLTKQWVVLPPCPPCRVIFTEWGLKPWVGLVCQEPYDEYTQDYKFRVVVIDQFRPPVYELLVYCSEIGEWKKFNLRVSISPGAEMHHQNYIEFQGVVCNGIIYLHLRNSSSFAAFNPFDLDETTDTTTIEAKVLPSLPYPIDGYLRESSGQLFVIHNPEREYELGYHKNGRAIELPLMVWKLDPNLVPLTWKTVFEGSCTGNVNIMEGIEISYHVKVWNIGMHPNNEKLIYMHLLPEKQLVSCDTRTRLIKPLKSLARYSLETFDRLELQWWPTSVPKAYLSNASE